MTGVPDGLREALTEAIDIAAREWTEGDYGEETGGEYVANALVPVLVSWLAVHDAEVRQQGRNEAAQVVDELFDLPRVFPYAKPGAFDGWLLGIRDASEATRGGSDLKGQDDGD